ncbi:MAG: carboxylating nicotinate-nucleotide diphosphorylase [Phycisphaeraceae bacterium]|nr:carboxylating nicotinate-nucleotide diphosphorylase [Phycisphaeraceae bacterium]
MPRLDEFVSDDALDQLIALAVREDMGWQRRDLTSEAIIPVDASATARMVSRSPGIVCGLSMLQRIAAAFDPKLAVKLYAADGDAVTPGSCVAEITGTLRSILAAERTALNFVCHLSGIATFTSRFVEAVAGTRAKIYDTRKTIPAYRGLAKFAVVCGGGCSHRMGLHDAVLIKDNHLAYTAMDELAQAIARARSGAAFVEIEVDTRQQLQQVLTMGADIVLLDNMPPEVLKQAVDLRDQIAPQVKLEASGGVTLDNVPVIAETGVDRIAIGALTHSAPALDLGLDIEQA